MSEAIAAAAAHQQQQQLEKQVEEGSATDVTQANGHTSNWVVGFDSQRKTQYFYNVVTGESVWQLPEGSTARPMETEHQDGIVALAGDVPEATVHLEVVEEILDDADAQWQECQCRTSGDLYYVHKRTGIAQWNRPQSGQIADLGWSLSRVMLQMSNEVKFAGMSVLALGLLAGGAYHGYRKELKKNSGKNPMVKVELPSTAQTRGGAGRPLRRRRLRSQAVDPRHVAAGQAMRALGIATIGSVATFGGIVLFTATAMRVSSAKEFGDQMRDVVPAIKNRIGEFVEPLAQSVREVVRSLEVSKAARELKQQQQQHSSVDAEAAATAEEKVVAATTASQS